MSHSRSRRRVARATGHARPPREADRYEDLGHLAGFPVQYDTFTRTWIVMIHDEVVRFDRQAVIHTTELMKALFLDGARRDEGNTSCNS